MRLDDLTKRADELVAQAKACLETARPADIGSYVTSDSFAGLRSAALSFIERVYGRDHPHYTEFDKQVEGVSSYFVERAVGILTAIRDEIKGGWLLTTRGLLSAEVFEDFLEMAEHLLDGGYKDPAAVLVGGVLEEHLRQLAVKHRVTVDDLKSRKPVPRRADAINADLTKAGAYGRLDQKNITAWLDLRNNAAHGNFTEYNKDQVANLLSGVREFIARTPL